jgi:hypothetical protein
MLQINIQSHAELLHVEGVPINAQPVTDFTCLLSREMLLGYHFLFPLLHDLRLLLQHNVPRTSRASGCWH